jgi:hypothetical protein
MAAGLKYVEELGAVAATIVGPLPLPVTTTQLPAALVGQTLVQISDIHIGTGMTKERLERIVEMINEQQPEAVAITGDFVTHGDISEHAVSLREALSQLVVSDSSFAVLGNHDHWTAPGTIQQVIRDSGIVELSNTVYTLQRGGAVLHIAGVDSYWEHLDRLDDVLFQLPDEGAAILLAHEPEAAVRAVLGHHLFVFIHPYFDGNGRIGRFLMNAMLASGGYPWTVIRFKQRVQYMAALEAASVQGEIKPLVKFIAQEMRVGTPRARGTRNLKQ